MSPRESLAAHRSKAKAANAAIDAELARQKAERDADHKALKEAAADAERLRRKYTRDDMTGATHVLDQFGKLRQVLRVNRLTVSVTTEWSWAETIPFDKIRGVKR